MKRRPRTSRAKKTGASHDDKEISAETVTTRLYADDLVEVRALCGAHETESSVVRDLVRRALYARRYKQATNDPAFRELLRTFDDMVGRRIHHLEQRLRGLMNADFDTLIRLIAYMKFVVNFDAEELKQLRLEMTPETVTDEEFTAAWQARFDSRKQRALSALNKTLATRQKQTADRDRRHQGFDPSADDEPGGATPAPL